MSPADLNRWPGIARVPRSPSRAAAARQLVRRAVCDLPVTVRLPDGMRLGLGGPELEIVSGAFFHRISTDLKIGFGEAYMAGDRRAGSGSDLADVLTVFTRRLPTLVPPALQRFRKLLEPSIAQSNDRAGARASVAHHNDLSNELFATFLDSTMTYSSALFTPGDTPADAQRRKIDSVLDLAGVRPGAGVLEIGTGWGELAIQAATRGAVVRTITLSVEQRDLARKRIAQAGVPAAGFRSGYLGVSQFALTRRSTR